MSTINLASGNTLLQTGLFPPARVASTGSPLNPSTGGLLTVDGTVLTVGDRVLCKDETSAVNNGIYAAQTGPWTRTSDASNNQQFFSGMCVTVALGAINKGTIYMCTCADDPVVVGTSLLTFAAIVGGSGVLTGPARTVLGVAGSSTAPFGNITASSGSGGILRENGGTLGFGTTLSASSYSLTASGAALNIGATGGSNTPAVNFFSSGNPVSYDSRLVATGGNSSQGGGTIVLDGELEIVPQASSLMSAIFTQQSAHGSTGGTQQYNNLVEIISDDTDCGSSPTTSFSLGFYVQHTFGGSNATGGREALFGNLILTAATKSSNGVRFYVGVSGQGQCNASDGGTIGGGEKGEMYGSNFIGALANGATGFVANAAGLDQVDWLTGSSGKTKAIRIFSYGSQDAVQGNTTDAALIITADTGATAGGKIGILIGNVRGAQPLATTGTILALTGSPTIGSGIDLTGAGTISNFAFKSPGFSVAGTGGIVSGANGGTAGSLTLFGSSSGSATIGVSSTGMPQYPGTSTNDNAPTGDLGELVSSNCPTSDTSATVTVTIASPAVVTWTSHPFLNTGIRQDAAPIVFTTTGALPTGITSGTVYWVIPSTITANTFEIATSVANAIAGTAVNTSGTQSGTQTATAGCNPANTTAKNITGIPLGAGDWDVWGVAHYTNTTASAAINYLEASLSTTADTLDTNAGKIGTLATLGSTPFNFAADRVTQAVGPFRFSFSGTTNVYLVGKGSFANTLGMGGTILARRRR